MKITENTTLSIGLVIAVVGGIYWLSFIAFETHANGAAIIDIQQSREQKEIDNRKFQREVLDRLIRIEGKISQ